MKKIKITKRGLVIVDEEGNVINEQTWASIDLAFMAFEDLRRQKQCFALAADAQEFWKLLVETKQYQDWANNL